MNKLALALVLALLVSTPAQAGEALRHPVSAVKSAASATLKGTGKVLKGTGRFLKRLFVFAKETTEITVQKTVEGFHYVDLSARENLQKFMDGE